MYETRSANEMTQNSAPTTKTDKKKKRAKCDWMNVG